MSSAGLSITGLASGLDTAQILSELMRVERIPVTSMQRRQAQDRTKVEAFGEITTKLSSLRDAQEGLTDLSDFRAFALAESSDEDAVGASVSGEAQPGSFTFTVDQLALQQQSASASGLATADASVGAGTVTISIGGTDHEITTTAGTSLSDLARQISDLGAGVSASVLQVDDGDHRLVVNADETGDQGAFTISTTSANLDDFEDIQAAQDAVVRLGSGAGALQVRRSSNSVDDLVDGVTLNLRAASADPVTITTTRDVDAAMEKIKGLVDATNDVLTTARDKSKYVVDGDSGPLNGQSAIRDLIFDLEGSLSSPVNGLTGATSYASAVGIELERGGGFTVDEAKLREALENDFDGVARIFARQGSATDDRVSFQSASDATEVGTYEVQVTRAARIAMATGAAYNSPPGDPEVFRVRADDGTEVEVAVSAGDTAAEAVTKINAALAAGGISTISASFQQEQTGTNIFGQPIYDDVLSLAESRAGSLSFTVESISGTRNAFGLTGTHTGEDVEGTINGLPATGTGRTLTSTETDGASQGLVVQVGVSQDEVDAAGGTLSLGAVEYARGLTGAVDDLLGAYEGTDGRLERAKGLVDDRIADLQERIEDYELRLVDRETYLRRQFTAMEQAISNIQSQGNFFFQQLGLGG